MVSDEGDGTSVSQSTTAFLSYDDGHLYAVFVCKDDPAAIRANVARREDIGADDAVGLYLDTFHDRQRAYLFMVSPLGVQLDGIVTEGQSWDYIFDAVWKSEGRLTADGYVVRLTIPFRSLRFRRGGDQTWGIALSRVIRRNNEEAYWPQLTKRVQGFVPQFGTLQGLRNISPGRNVEVLPYGVLARARVLDEDAAALRSDREARLGIDAKLVVRDAVTLDATSNPDFSQVESDDPQVTVNERFGEGGIRHDRLVVHDRSDRQDARELIGELRAQAALCEHPGRAGVEPADEIGLLEPQPWRGAHTETDVRLRRSREERGEIRRRIVVHGRAPRVGCLHGEPLQPLRVDSRLGGVGSEAQSREPLEGLRSEWPGSPSPRSARPGTSQSNPGPAVLVDVAEVDRRARAHEIGEQAVARPLPLVVLVEWRPTLRDSGAPGPLRCRLAGRCSPR
jgi:hypothetical protein